MDSAHPPASPRPRGCTCFRLRRLARRVTAMYDAELACVGLTVGQFSLLGMAQAAEAPTLTELAERMEMDRTTLTRNLRPLAARGLVESARGDDARARRVWVTDAGRALWQDARGAWRRAQERIERTLGHEGVAALHDVLDDALARIHDPGRPA